MGRLGWSGARTRMLVMADDLTGACDVGAEFSAAGWPALVPLRGTGGPRSFRVFNTQSRDLPRAAAARRVKKLLAGPAPRIVFKKIDTALRGHVGAELQALLEEMPGGVAIIAPSIPEIGRYTRGGCQWSSGVPVERSFAWDAASRVPGSSIVEVLARQTPIETQAFALEVVRGGRLRVGLESAISCGRRIMVLDSESEEDLAAIVECARGLERPVVFVGSTGLARAWAGRAGRGVKRELSAWPAAVGALVVVGSAHPVAHGQAEAAVLRGAARLFTVDGGGGQEAVVSAAATELAAGRHAIVSLPRARGRLKLAERRRSARALAQTALGVVRRCKPQRLFLVGGGTAHAVLDLARAESIGVHGTWAPLVASTTIWGGELDRVPLLIKGGSTGEESLLCEALGGEGAGETVAAGGGARLEPCAYRF